MRLLRLLGRALAKFWRDQGLFLASGIAFQVVLCLIPLALVVLSFAGSYLFSHERLIEQFARYLEQAAPALDVHVRRNILAVVAHRGTTGFVGTLGLLWIATTVFGWLRLATGSLWPSVVAHLSLNTLTFLVAPYVDDPSQTYTPSPVLGAACLAAGTAVAWPLLRAMRVSFDSPRADS